MEYFSVDRIEGQLAVCESDSRSTIELPLSQLPAETRPGDVLSFDGVAYKIDAQETRRRREAAAALQKKLFRRK